MPALAVRLLVLAAALWATLVAAPLAAQAPPNPAAPPAAAPAPAAPAAAAADPDGWPSYPFPAAHQIDRGPGGYLSITKIVLLILLFLLWVKTTEWVSLDCEATDMPYIVWTSAAALPFLFTFFLIAITFPIFLVGYFALVLAHAVPLGIYIYQRNEKVTPSKQILTADWFRALLADPLKILGGGPVEAKPKYSHEEGPPIVLTGLGGANDQVNQANTILARQSPGYVLLKQSLVEALGRRAEKVVLEYTQQAVSVKYQIDGVLFDAEGKDRENGDLLLAVAKKLANLNMEDRKSRQEGRFAGEYNKQKYTFTLLSQGTPTGERAILTLPGVAVELKTLADCGMREKMIEQVKELISQPKGVFILSALPAGGLSTTTTALLKSTDRYMRDFVSVDEVGARKEPEVENVAQEYYSAAAGEKQSTKLPAILRKQPNVLVLRDLADGQALNEAFETMNEASLLVITSLRAKDAPEALLRVLALKPNHKEYAQRVIGVLGQRLVRKLCTGCREAYVPAADLLQKLGIPAGRVEAFYREPTPKPPDPNNPPPEPCQQCGGIGYYGRTAIYELIVADDLLRRTLATEPKLESLRAAARKSGNRTLQEEGIALVAKGVTSLNELMRVLKQ